MTRAGSVQAPADLVDLRDQPDTYWDAPKTPAREQAGLRLGWDPGSPLVAASPWTIGGTAEQVVREGGVWLLPAFRRWPVVVRR